MLLFRHGTRASWKSELCGHWIYASNLCNSPPQMAQITIIDVKFVSTGKCNVFHRF